MQKKNKKVSKSVEKRKLSLAEQEQVLRTQRERECAFEIQKILSRYNCTIVVPDQITITAK